METPRDWELRLEVPDAMFRVRYGSHHHLIRLVRGYCTF